MATTTMHPSPVPTPSSTPSPHPPFPRLPSGSLPNITRNASTSSSCSTATTSSSSSSLVAAPIRPPPIETRTAATNSAQLPPRPSSADPHSPRPGRPYNPRGISRNGPRSRNTTPYTPPIRTGAVAPTITTPERASTAPPDNISPTTPRAPRWIPDEEGRAPRVMISNEPAETADIIPSSSGYTTRQPRGRAGGGQWSSPSSPIDQMSPPQYKPRTLSVDGREEVRERRTSQASSASTSGMAKDTKKPSLNDFVVGEELGRGSYSTVVQATPAVNTSSPTSARPPRQYAIKIINQAHLIAERKAKYAVIERDALIRLAKPDKELKGHRRGVSSSSSAGQASSAPRRRSNASNTSAAGTKRDGQVVPGSMDRLSVASDMTAIPVPTSPVSRSTLAGRRPSRSAGPPEMVPERSEENVFAASTGELRSRPPSPVREESGESTPSKLSESTLNGSPMITTAPPTPDPSEKRTPRNRRQSLAPSEKSVKSAGKPTGSAHPGIIRLFSTFNDQTSLYFVLEMAKNGELLTYIRKFGSLDIDSARYYAAQLIDTIEFMHEREIIHRDLKPENILLDGDMRIKITDFGSAKILGPGVEAQDDGRKRSFVGSADFVSPEVLRNEPAIYASDIWAFGCILFQLLVGKPPFRGATDYLTFQKILKREFEYPDGMDEQAKDLIDAVLKLETSSRPVPSEIKNHPFFLDIDFSTLWQTAAPIMSSGLAKPSQTTANHPTDSEVWAVFDDEVSDGGFEFDDAEPSGEVGRSDQRDHSAEPRYDRHAAADAVQFVDYSRRRGGSDGSLEPPRPAFVDGQKKKGSKWSSGTRSARTSSSSSNNRTALTGLLETMGIHSYTSNAGTPSTGTPKGSIRTNRMSRASDKGEEIRPQSHMQTEVRESDQKWSSLLLTNERVVHSSAISARPGQTSALLPSFLQPASKRRQLILTDFPRLIEVKDEKDEADKGPKVKFEAVFVRQPTGHAEAPSAQGSGGANRVLDVQEKGTKGFVVNTASISVQYTADSAETRDYWMQVIRGVVPA